MVLVCVGFLQLCGQPEYLFKPVFSGRKGEQELSFYETVFFSNEASHFAQDLRLLVPRYFGVEVIADRRGVPCILFVVFIDYHFL